MIIMNNAVTNVSIIKDFLVEIQFQDGFKVRIDLKKYLNKGFAKELLDRNKFEKIFIEDGGGLAWPNGFDICPNFLRELADKNTSENIVKTS